MQPFSFIHMADTHLGYRQYKLKERFRDFNASFINILNLAIEKEVNFILLAGDMFQSTNIKPDTLTAVYQIISRYKTRCLEEVGREIPILAIQGNHDKNYSAYQVRTWMEFLADLDLIKLLQENYDRDTDSLTFEPYSEDSHIGGYYEIPDLQVRIFGMQYYGSVTPRFFPKIEEEISVDDDYYQILMMHFGIEDQIEDKPGGIKLPAMYEDLRKKIDYVATGHFHKQYRYPYHDPWIYNPGSTEVNDAKEVFRADEYERCVFYVQHDGEKIHPQSIKFDIYNQHNENELPNRHSIRVGPFNFTNICTKKKINTWKETMAHVIESVRKVVPERKKDGTGLDEKEKPMLFVSLTGTIPYSRMEIDYHELHQELQNSLDILHVRVYGWLESELDGISISTDKELSIHEIEEKVFHALIEINPDYSEKKDSLYSLILDLKEEILTKDVNYGNIARSLATWFDSHIKMSDGEIQAEIEEMLKEDDDMSTTTPISDSASSGQETVQGDAGDIAESPTISQDENVDEDELIPTPDMGGNDADFEDW